MANPPDLLRCYLLRRDKLWFFCNWFDIALEHGRVTERCSQRMINSPIKGHLLTSKQRNMVSYILCSDCPSAKVAKLIDSSSHVWKNTKAIIDDRVKALYSPYIASQPARHSIWIGHLPLEKGPSGIPAISSSHGTQTPTCVNQIRSHNYWQRWK